ncbi:MAG: carboxypeptidase regulatory-like domain-containing protein [Phycisphaerales bacterium]|nr:carboxypeptidase regulatory-like domain-containing protein [Phycisphaerales bacterium]
MKLEMRIRENCVGGHSILTMLCLGLIAVMPAAAQLGPDWIFSANGQNTSANANGSFQIRNIAAPDLFGANGPGSAPDFLSDDWYRVTGMSTVGGVTRYAWSEYFQIRSRQTFVISELSISDEPPPSVVDIDLSPADGQPFTLTDPGQTSQLEGIGTQNTGDTFDLISLPWSTFRISNRNVGTISRTGLFTAVNRGTAFVTLTNEGATGVTALTVAPGDPLTTVDGFAHFEDGSPAAGAEITLLTPAGAGIADENGHFTIPGVASIQGQISVRAETFVEGERFAGGVSGLEPVRAGITDAGIIVLQFSPPDTDGDCLPDEIEIQVGLDPNDSDTDNDGLPDGAEDLDNDSLVNCQEYLLGTRLDRPDTDGDGIVDGIEVLIGTDPLVPDNDPPLQFFPDRPLQLFEGKPAELQVFLSQAAPAGGVSVTLSSDDRTIATVSPSVFIPAGQTTNSTQRVQISGVTNGTTVIRADAPGQTPTAVQVSVGQTGTLTLRSSIIFGTNPTFVTGASGLYHDGYVDTNRAAPPGGRRVTFTTSNPAVFRLTRNFDPPQDSITVTIPAGQTSSSSSPIRIVGLSTGSATLTASAPGFANTASNVVVREPALVLTGLPATIDVLDPRDLFQIGVNCLNAAGNGFEFGAGNLRVFSDQLVSLESSAPDIGMIVDRDGVERANTLIRQGQAFSNGSSSSDEAAFFQPIAEGATQVRAFADGFNSANSTNPQSVIVTQASFAFVSDIYGSGVSTFVTASSGLYHSGYAQLSAPAPAGGLEVTFSSSDPAVFRIAPNNFSPQDSITVVVPTGTTHTANTRFRLVGLSAGTAVLTASADGFADRTINVVVRQPGLGVAGLVTSIDVIDPPDAFAVTCGAMNAAGNGIEIQLPSIADLRVEAAATNANIGEIVDRHGQPLPMSFIRAGQSATSTSAGSDETFFFLPLATGSTPVLASQVGFNSSNSSNPVTVSVTNATFQSFVSDIYGTGLTTFVSGADGLYHSGYVTLSAPAPAGGLDVKFVTSDPRIFRIAANNFSPQDEITVNVPAGQTNTAATRFRIVGLVSGSAIMTVQASGFADRTVNVVVRQSGLGISGLLTTIDAIDPPDLFQVVCGAMNAGGTAIEVGLPTINDLTMEMISSAPPIGDIVDRLGNFMASGVIRQGQNSTSSNQSSDDALFFRPSGDGVTTITARRTDFDSTHNSNPVNVTVTTATFTSFVSDVYGTGVTSFVTGGLGLYHSGYVNLSAPAPAEGLQVTFSSSDPTVFQIAPSTFDPETEIVVNVPAGQTNTASTRFRLVGAGLGTASLTVQAPGFTTRSIQVTVRQPALGLTGLPTTIGATNPSDLFQVTIGVMNAAGTSIEVNLPTIAEITSEIVSNTPDVGVVVNRLGQETSQAIIRQGQSSTSGNSGNDDALFFDPLSLGTTEINAVLQGFDSTNNSNPQVVTVIPSTFTSFVSDVQGGGITNYLTGAMGIYHSGYVTLSAPAPAEGLLVTFTSNSPDIFLLAANDFSPLEQITVVIPAGDTSTSRTRFRIVGDQIGTSTMTVSAAGYTDRTVNVTVRQPAIGLAGVATPIGVSAPADIFQVGCGVASANGATVELFLPTIADLSVDVVSNSPEIGIIVDRAGQPVDHTFIRQGQTYSSNSGSSDDAVFFDPLAPGTTAVHGVANGFDNTNTANPILVTVAP